MPAAIPFPLGKAANTLGSKSQMQRGMDSTVRESTDDEEDLAGRQNYERDQMKRDHPSAQSFRRGGRVPQAAIPEPQPQDDSNSVSNQRLRGVGQRSYSDEQKLRDQVGYQNMPPGAAPSPSLAEGGEVPDDGSNIATKTVAAATKMGGPKLGFRAAQHYRMANGAYKHGAAAALRGNQQKPANLDQAIDGANKAADNIPNGQSVRFAKSNNGVTATVTGEDGKAQQIPLTLQQFHDYLVGQSGQFDHQMTLGPGKMLQQLAQGGQGAPQQGAPGAAIPAPRQAGVAPQQAPPQQAPQAGMEPDEQAAVQSGALGMSVEDEPETDPNDNQQVAGADQRGVPATQSQINDNSPGAWSGKPAPVDPGNLLGKTFGKKTSDAGPSPQDDVSVAQQAYQQGMLNPQAMLGDVGAEPNQEASLAGGGTVPAYDPGGTVDDDNTGMVNAAQQSAAAGGAPGPDMNLLGRIVAGFGALGKNYMDAIQSQYDIQPGTSQRTVAGMPEDTGERVKPTTDQMEEGSDLDTGTNALSLKTSRDRQEEGRRKMQIVRGTQTGQQRETILAHPENYSEDERKAVALENASQKAPHETRLVRKRYMTNEGPREEDTYQDQGVKPEYSAQAMGAEQATAAKKAELPGQVAEAKGKVSRANAETRAGELEDANIRTALSKQHGDLLHAAVQAAGIPGQEKKAKQLYDQADEVDQRFKEHVAKGQGGGGQSGPPAGFVGPFPGKDGLMYFVDPSGQKKPIPAGR